jgi:hypothetical protein
MSKEMEFACVHKQEAIKISGPDVDGDYCITTEGINDYSRVYVSRRTLAEMRAFLCELLDGGEE